MPDQNFPSPSTTFRGPRQSPPKNLADTAAKWAIKGLNLPDASTLALYAGRLVDKETGEAYSADELLALLASVATKYVDTAPDDVYELTTEDNGKLILLDVADPTIVGIGGTLPVGFNVGVIQWGAGALTFATDTGTIRSAGDLVESAEQYGVTSVAVVLPSTILLSGNLA
jgi:hypothetical protein